MKWNTAIKKIEKALDENRTVEISYHRKWLLQDYHTDIVTSVSEYDWYDGKKCKAINTYADQLDESSHIIEKIYVE